MQATHVEGTFTKWSSTNTHTHSKNIIYNKKIDSIIFLLLYLIISVPQFLIDPTVTFFYSSSFFFSFFSLISYFRF